MKPTELVAIHLIGLPLPDQAAAAEHFDGLLREFALINTSDETRSGVPARLISLRNDLVSRFESFTADAVAHREAAVARGETVVDLTFHVPAEAAAAAAELADLLDEADDYCRAGEHLLTLATPPHLERYRRWYLGEFIRQTEGLPPIPWGHFDR